MSARWPRFGMLTDSILAVIDKISGDPEVQT